MDGAYQSFLRWCHRVPKLRPVLPIPVMLPAPPFPKPSPWPLIPPPSPLSPLRMPLGRGHNTPVAFRPPALRAVLPVRAARQDGRQRHRRVRPSRRTATGPACWETRPRRAAPQPRPVCLFVCLRVCVFMCLCVCVFRCLLRQRRCHRPAAPPCGPAPAVGVSATASAIRCLPSGGSLVVAARLLLARLTDALPVSRRSTPTHPAGVAGPCALFVCLFVCLPLASRARLPGSA